MKKRIQPHIMCGVGDIAKYVLLPGDPNRVKKIASFFDEANKVAEYRGFITYTGRINDIKITACSTGIGCPSTAIVVEELTRIGANTLIRVGTTGALQPDIKIGEIIVATGAVRADGASRAYIPLEYPAIADFNVTLSLLKSAKKLGKIVHHGIVLSSDAFYSGSDEELSKFRKGKVLSVEMEASTIFTLANIKGLRAGAILTVDGSLVEGTQKSEFEPDQISSEFDERVIKGVEDEIKIAIEAVKLLDQDHSLL